MNSLIRVSTLFIGVLFATSVFASPDTSIRWLENRDGSGTFEIQTVFPKAEFEKDRVGKAVPIMPGLMLSMEGGLPMIPLKPLHIALPGGYGVDSVVVEEGAHQHLDIELASVSGMAPISWRQNPPRVLLPAAAPNFVGSQYPESRYRISLQKLHGTSIALVTLYPLVVQRGGGVEYVDSLTVHLNLVRTGGGGPTPLLLHQVKDVKSFVDNPEMVLAPVQEKNGYSYDYLIIATQKVIDYKGTYGLTDFQTALSDRGITSQVANLKDIDAVAGTDRIEKIREYIRSQYKNSGIKYVLLIGRSKDSSTEGFLPSRPMWSKIKAYFGGSSWVDLEEQIPADLYYSNLDGTFNYNNDKNWGETTDGDKGGDVDFLPEVAVGRVVIDSDLQLQQFVKKSVWAGTHAISKNTILAGEMLFTEMNLYGDDYMEQLIGSCTDHKFETTGYPAEKFTFKKLYDRTTRGWTGTDALTAINATTFGMINHLGHSNNSYNFRMSSSSINTMKNVEPFFYYTQGCFAGGFTTGSFVDKLLTAPNAGFAAVGNSTYGLAPEDPQFDSTKTPGGSQMLHRQFIHALMTKGIHEFGLAHQESKRAFIDLKTAQEIRWVNWGATFFGDPSLKLNFAD